MRSVSALTLIASATTSNWRQQPSPPRHLPAPPESGRISYLRTRSGKRVSNTSIGVARIVLACAQQSAVLPSLPSRPPQPPPSS